MPIAVDVQLQTDEDVQINSRFEASDEDNEIFAFQITSLPENIRLALVDAVLGDFELHRIKTSPVSTRFNLLP